MLTSEIQDQIDILLTYPSDGMRIFHSMIPFGLVSIGTVLQQAGYSIKLIDFNHYVKDFRRELSILRPKVVGIGGTTPTRMGSFLTARIVKEILPDTTVIYGGINATFTSTEILSKVPHIDFIVKGEGEHSFLKICDIFLGQSQECLYETPGLCWRSENGIRENKPQRIHDLSTIPIANRSLLGDNYQVQMEFTGAIGDFIMTSRGCPAACNFCSASKMFPGGVRLRPMDSVMDEIEYLRARKNIAGLKLFDSTFTANREHVIKFCDNIRSFSIPWECEIRADTVDRDLLKLMKQSGCYYVNIGMETSNVNHLKHIAKGISPTQVVDVLSFCKELGIYSKAFFTFGHVGQTFDECMQDIRFIEENKKKIDFFAVTVGMRIYPGTRLEEECRQRGILGKNFSWLKSARKLSNLFVLEPSDTPLLFQKQLGPLKLLVILVILFWRRLICTEAFLLRMVGENIIGMLRSGRMTMVYTSHRLKRLQGKMTGM